MLPVAPRAQEKLVAGGFTDDDYPSAEAYRILQERFGLGGVGLVLVVSHPEWEPHTAEFITELNRMIEPVRGHPIVERVETHLDDPSFVSDSGDSAIVEIVLDLDLEESLEVLDEISSLIDPGQLSVLTTGGPALYRDIVEASGADLRRSETVAFPLATLTLLIVFGTLVAAFMPVMVGGVAVAIGLGAVYYLAGVRDMSVLSFNVITLLGIGMGIDYSLFYVNRFREELSEGRTVEDALIASHSRAGLAILFSGLTSVIGLAGLLLFDLPVFESVGIGAVLVISVALLSAMTLMPAILGVIGHRVNRLRILPTRRISNGFWRPVAGGVMRRPLLVLAPSIGFLVLLTLPIKDLQLGTVDGSVLPTTYESRRGYDLLRAEFGWDLRTELLAILTFEGDPLSEENLAHLYAFGRAMEGLKSVDRVTSVVNLRPTLGLEDYKNLYRHPESIYDGTTLRVLNDSLRNGAAIFAVSSPVYPFSPEARKIVSEIRAFDGSAGYRVQVAGAAASLKDQINSLYGRLPFVAAGAMFLTFLSLMYLFRSIVIPLKAVILNVLSISASYGALVWVFQEGNLSGVLMFEPLETMPATIPILLLAVLFGLSMDYEIFLLSRVREAYLETGSNRESVMIGLQKSGMIITGAGAILVVVGASFVLADVVTVKIVGLGLALAVFIDVTIVRILIAPALMRLFGRWNWWLPSWLDRLLPTAEFER